MCLCKYKKNGLKFHYCLLHGHTAIHLGHKRSVDAVSWSEWADSQSFIGFFSLVFKGEEVFKHLAINRLSPRKLKF